MAYSNIKVFLAERLERKERDKRGGKERKMIKKEGRGARREKGRKESKRKS